MSEKKTDAVAAKFAAMDKPELQHALVKSAKKLGEAKKQIQQKDKLIADFTSQREKAKREASQLIAQAKEHAEEIEKKVAVKEAELEKKIEETDAEVARKLTNANAEADSIVESRLNEAKGEIEKLERRRDEAKRAAIALNKNIIERYDGLITEVEEQISRFKDMQESLAGFNVDIEAEDFKKFDMSDYVTSTPKEKKASVKTPAKADSAEPKSIEMHEKSILDVDNDDVSLDDDELEMLAYVFEGDYDDDDEEEEETPTELEDSELLSDEDLDFLNSDFDFDMDFGDGDDDEDSADIEVEEEEDDVFSDGTMKSFTDSFMAVRATDDDDDDLDDIDIDSILDDDDEEETPAPKITVPARRHRRNGKNNPSRWIS